MTVGPGHFINNKIKKSILKRRFTSRRSSRLKINERLSNHTTDENTMVYGSDINENDCQVNDNQKLSVGENTYLMNNSIANSGRKYPNRNPQYFSTKLENDFLSNLFSVKNYQIRVVASDGSCLYRSVAYQVFGNEERAQSIRFLVHHYVKSHWDFFQNFVTLDKKTYLDELLKPTTYGDHPEIQAIAEIFQVPIEIYTYDTEPSVVINNGTTSPKITTNNLTPIRLSFHNNNHYNAIIDLNAPPLSKTIILPASIKNILKYTVDTTPSTSYIAKNEASNLTDKNSNEKCDNLLSQNTNDTTILSVSKINYNSFSSGVNSKNNNG